MVTIMLERYFKLTSEMCNFMVVLILLSLSIVFGADTETFKNCSRVDFCKRLRSYTPPIEKVFEAHLYESSHFENVISVPLVNSETVLTMEIRAIEGGSFRITIDEKDSHRYRVPLVLDPEPALVKMHVTNVNGDYSYDIYAEDGRSSHLTLWNDPATVIFSDNNRIPFMITGDHLIWENSETSKAFAISADILGSHNYGAHQHAASLSLTRTDPNLGPDPFRFRNSDNGYYDVESPMAMYGAVPAVFGVGNNISSGIFLLNAGEVWLDTPKDGLAQFIAESGSLDLFLLPGSTLKDTVRQYTKLTGVTPLPQLWTLGFHQSRYSYLTQEIVKDVVALFDTNKFPLDAIWLDIDYTDEKKYFTWNPETFSDPEEMLKNISSTNRRVVPIIDPHLKVDRNYSVYKNALDKDLFIKNANGSNYEGNCWPGMSSWLDFLNPEARDYYSDLFSYDKFIGSTETLAGIWNDMNEPAVFDNDHEKTVPFDTLHHDGVEHRDIHNIYGFLQTIGTYNGLLKRDKGEKRPFILTRSHFAGSQRYAAIWTGDNVADWAWLRITYPMCLTSNLFGIVFCGADVGGFNGNPTIELLQRWFQSAIWLPFFRSHTSGDNREPYLFQDDVQEVLRDAIETRYKHIPYWYTLFFEHERTGDPVIRTLSYHYQEDEAVYEIDDHLLVGENILVRHIYNPGEEIVSVYFPDEYWYQINERNTFKGPGYQNISVNMSFIPVFYRAGSIIPRKDIIRGSTTDGIDDPYSLYVNLDKENVAEGTLYLDDFTSFKYRDELKYNYVKLSWNGTSVAMTKIDQQANSSGFNIKIDQVIVNQMSDEKERYTQTIYKETANGTILSEISFKITEPIVLTF